LPRAVTLSLHDALPISFAAGIAVGAGGRALWVRYASAAAPERTRGLDRMMDELNAELRLDPAQRDSVRAILQRHRTRMTAVWETDRKSTRLNSSHQIIS